MDAKYNRIGKNYNQTRKADPFIASRLVFHLQPEKGKHYLDIGCGTGNYTLVLAQSGGSFTGIDPSERMLETAGSTSTQIEWQKGSAETLNMKDHSFDGLVASLTLHHWTDLNQGFLQLYRVLKPKGRFVIFTSTPSQMEGYWLNHYFPNMMKASCLQMPSEAQILSAMERAGFAPPQKEIYEIQPDLQDGFLYVGKHDPKRYLDPELRKGISSFSALAHQEEVEQGLKRLNSDIESGKIKSIMDAYVHDKGDYLFLHGQK